MLTEFCVAGAAIGLLVYGHEVSKKCFCDVLVHDNGRRLWRHLGSCFRKVAYGNKVLRVRVFYRSEDTMGGSSMLCDTREAAGSEDTGKTQYETRGRQTSVSMAGTRMDVDPAPKSTVQVHS